MDQERFRIFAVVGLCGVGKSSVTEYIGEKYKLPVVYFGGMITKEVARRKLSVNATNERLVRDELRKVHGMSAIAALAEAEMNEKRKASNMIVIDGIYSGAEVGFITERITKSLTVIAIHSSKKDRYRRMASRKVRPLTQIEVDERDQSEIKSLDKATPIVLADFHIVNDGNIDDLHSRIDSVMQAAFSQSLE